MELVLNICLLYKKNPFFFLSNCRHLFIYLYYLLYIFHLSFFLSLLFRACYLMLPSSKLDHRLLNVFNCKTPTISKASFSTSCNKYILTPSTCFFCCNFIFISFISFFSFNMLIKGKFAPHFHNFHY